MRNADLHLIAFLFAATTTRSNLRKCTELPMYSYHSGLLVAKPLFSLPVCSCFLPGAFLTNPPRPDKDTYASVPQSGHAYCRHLATHLSWLYPAHSLVLKFFCLQHGLAFVAFHSHCQFFPQKETSGCLLLSACAMYVAQVRLNWLIINVSGYERSWHRGGS